MLPLKDYSLNECGANVAVSFTADTSMPWSDLVHRFVVDVCGAFDRKLERKRERAVIEVLAVIVVCGRCMIEICLLMTY